MVEEAKAFLVAAKTHRLGILYATTFFLRRGEVLGLKWASVDLDNSRLWVRHALQRQKDKGLVLVEPKSRTSRRPLALPPFVVDALREQRRQQLQQRVFLDRSG